MNYDRFASLLVNYCLDVQPKQTISVNADIVAIELVEEIYKYILISGAYPQIDLSNSIFTELFYEHANKDQLEHVSPISIFKTKNIDSTISIRSQTNTKALSNICTDKQQKRMNALKDLNQEISHKRWVLTLFPTTGYAQDAGMSLRDFTSFVSNALFLNKSDPVLSWKKLSENQEKYIEKIKHSEKVQIKSNEIDISFCIQNRNWINSDGKQNMPSGEIYTTPIEDSLNGYYYSSLSNSKYNKEINGVYIEFKNGNIVKIKAEKNEEYLVKLLETDEGAKTIGEFGIGLNYGINKPINNILFDEKIGGTVHIALGQSHEKTGGKNKSGIHLDLIADLNKDSEIIFDNKIFYKNGKFVL